MIIVEGVPIATALTLVEAMVATSDTPLLLLNGELNVVIASNSFCVGFGLDCAALVGRTLLAMGDGEWDKPQLRSLLVAVVGGTSVVDYEFDLPPLGERALRNLSLSAHRPRL